MQRVVGGLIEEIDLDNNTVLVCNEEGKLMNCKEIENRKKVSKEMEEKLLKTMKQLP